MTKNDLAHSGSSAEFRNPEIRKSKDSFFFFFLTYSEPDLELVTWDHVPQRSQRFMLEPLMV